MHTVGVTWRPTCTPITQAMCQLPCYTLPLQPEASTQLPSTRAVPQSPDMHPTWLRTPCWSPAVHGTYQRTKLHPPTSSQVLLVGCQSQAVISATCGHITCTSDVYVAWLRSCQSPSGWHHTWYSQKRPAETPSTNSQLQTTHSPQSQHA